MKLPGAGKVALSGAGYTANLGEVTETPLARPALQPRWLSAIAR